MFAAARICCACADAPDSSAKAAPPIKGSSAAPQSPFSIASWCGLLHASALYAHCLNLPIFMIGSFRPKIVTMIIRRSWVLRKCHFAIKMAKNRQRLALISYKEEPDVGRFARATQHAKGAVFTTPFEEHADRSNTDPAFCAWNACLAHSDLSPSPPHKPYARQIPEARLAASM